VLQEIERAYHIKFRVDDKNLLDQEITTSFKASPVEEVIAVLESLLDLNIARSGAAYIVVK
jgi:ferric-dicitrate binding protein FerR (iron transport regulator)